MNTMRLTPLAKIVISIVFCLVVLGGAYKFGVFDSVFTFKSSTPSLSFSGQGNKVPGAINISLDEWIGWKSIIDANGGLTTQPGSIYDKLGVKVNISIINDATQSSNALIKGNLDGAGYTVNRYAFLWPKFKENKVPVVMPYITNYSSGGDGIIAKKEINGVSDFVGKKIGVPKFSEAQTLVLWLMYQSNLSNEQISQVMSNMVMFDTPDDAAKAFFAGKVDAAATWQPYLSQAQTTPGTKLLFSTKSANSIILDGVVFRKDFLDANQDKVAKFIEGALQAENMYITQFGSIKSSMPLFSAESDDNIKAMSGDATLANYASNTKLLGGTAQALFSDMSKVWQSIGEKANPEDAAVAFDSSILNKLNGKFDTTINNTPKFSEAQRQQAVSQDNKQALLQKSITINFKTGSAEYDDSAVAVLRDFANASKILDGVVIQIEGNTDSIGDPTANKALSDRRARAISRALTLQGVDPSRFVVIGNGPDKPIATNTTEEGKAQNRRTDIFFKVVQ